MIYITLKLV